MTPSARHDDRQASPEHPWRDAWAERWPQLASAVGLSPCEPVLLALSGGADSVYLLHLLAAARTRPKVVAVHVDHQLRGEESESDAAFCARLCARLSISFARRTAELDPQASNLEARAREARYSLLGEEARLVRVRHILTGHHEDDALETLLLRWMRGSSLPGLAGLKVKNVLRSGPGQEQPVSVVRPLLNMRREEVRRLLLDAGLQWRDDSSNRSSAHTRNRVRNGLLPEIEATCGSQGVENLRAFASAVESLEEELASRTAHLAWSSDAGGSPRSGGSLARASLDQLAAPLLRRALWRLLSEGTGQAPSKALLAILEDDLGCGRITRRSLPGDWRLELLAEQVILCPPGSHAAPTGSPTPVRPERDPGTPPHLDTGRRVRGRESSSRPGQRQPAPDPGPPAGTGEPARGYPCAGAVEFPLPSELQLPDGRRLRASWSEAMPGMPPPRTQHTVELDARDLQGPLSVRWPLPRDRFHGLGAPGSKPLRRFLSDQKLPPYERGRVPLVVCGSEIIWVVGLRPCHRHRVRSDTARRLRLELRAE